MRSVRCSVASWPLLLRSLLWIHFLILLSFLWQHLYILVHLFSPLCLFLIPLTSWWMLSVLYPLHHISLHFFRSIFLMPYFSTHFISSSSFPPSVLSFLRSPFLSPLHNLSCLSFSSTVSPFPLIASHFHIWIHILSSAPADLWAPCGRIQVLGAELSLRGAPGLQDPGGVPRQEGRGEQTQPGSVSQLQRGPKNQIPILQPTMLKQDEDYISCLYQSLMKSVFCWSYRHFSYFNQIQLPVRLPLHKTS